MVARFSVLGKVNVRAEFSCLGLSLKREVGA